MAEYQSPSMEASGDTEDMKPDEFCVDWVTRKFTLLMPSSEKDNTEEELAEGQTNEDAWLSKVYNADSMLEVVEIFLTPELKEPRLYAHYDKELGQLFLSSGVPNGGFSELLYFVRDPNKPVVTPLSIDATVHFGVVNEDAKDALLRLMEKLYVPAVLSNKTWPDSIKKEFTGQVHKFMANLTEATYEAKGQTVLYIPLEEIGDVPEAAKEKDLVQRLESTLIHCTRQIKEVVNNQDNGDMEEDAGPLAEIEFWRARSVDLTGIRRQLDDEHLKKFVEVLEQAKSSYLEPFQSLSNLIAREAVAAEDNLKFLMVLQEPCEKLSEAEPKAIPILLPKMLHYIRMVWTHSRFYNTPERLTGLLRKVSNEIINRCCEKISLNEIFDGEVSKCMDALRESIAAGESWKGAYRGTAMAIDTTPEVPRWSFDVSSIFAHIDAFVQRCKDMLEVCEAQMQFAPKTDLPHFGGTRGPEITKSLNDIQASFQKLVAQLRGLNYSILDVKATRWHDDYNSFKNGVKDLEVMMTNVIVLGFDSVGSLSSRVELLDAFHSMAMRESIKRTVEKKTAECYLEYQKELNIVRKHFDTMRRSPPIDPMFPRYAGAAMWATGLARRIDKPMALLENSAHFLPVTPEREELQTAYTLFQSSIEGFIKSQHQDWYNTVDPALTKKLDNSLIVSLESEGGQLMMNFDTQMLKHFTEVHYWERLHMEIPYIAMEIGAQREKYRTMRENVLLVVRDYNAIIKELDSEERRLFTDRIHWLDRRIHPGISKLTWAASKHHLDFWIKEARAKCKEVYDTVIEYKKANEAIQQNCKTISETLLITVVKKKIYDNTVFEEDQKAHREKVQGIFERAYNEIREQMAATYEFFAGDTEEVQREWVRYTMKVDKKMEDALRYTVKKSLQELSRVLNGDAKTEVVPIFNVMVVLEKTNRVELRPTVQDMFNMIHNVSRELITVIQCVPRMVEQQTSAEKRAIKKAIAEREAQIKHLEDNQEEVPAELREPVVFESKRAKLPTFYDIISNDEDTTLKTIVHITTGITSIVDKVQQFLNYWEKKYKHIWDQDKEAYIRRYERAKKPLSAFDSDISKYKDLIDEVMMEDTATNMRFLRIDCGPLKQSLVSHCEAWVNKFTGLLNRLARQELEELQEYFSKNSTELKKDCTNLDMLASSVKLQHRLVDEKVSTQARFTPLEDKYRTLEKFEVQVSESEQAALASLPSGWGKFQQMLEDVAVDLEVAKENFREKLAKMVENFKKEVKEVRAEFEKSAPYTNVGYTTESAFKVINDAKDTVAAQRKRQEELKAGMDIFNMAQPPYKETADTAKELEHLELIWQVIKEWEDSYSVWKDGLFRDIKVEEMEEVAIRIGKRIVKLGRDIKAWLVWGAIRETVDSFKKTMPLITDLRNQAMRPRHWDQLMDQVGERFDPTGPEFTLGKVTELRLDAHAEFIGELSTNASKELAIEQSLESIGVIWEGEEGLVLDMVPYKDSKEIFKLRSTEDVYAALEDNVVTLSTMKSSKFFMVFEKQITYWEQSLSLVSEMIEITLTVQRNWMYLENIFVGSEDIRKQLPAESVMFDAVHLTFIQQMKDLADRHYVLTACLHPGVLDTFNEMDAQLEKIQKSLENYLESKRQQFPRFYFLSSDDLLEILGQAKDPMNVQPHLKKCFEGIKKLDMHLPGADGRRHCESVGVTSPDGEYLPFPGPVVTEGRPEDWLNKVEAAMFAGTKKMLYTTLEQAKSMKKEKWVKEFQGQCIISAGQIVWTNECERALVEAEGAKSALRQLKKKWVSYLNKLVGVTRARIDKVTRNKVVALITIEVHARDVIEKLAKTGCNSANDFDWVSQLRFYWDKDTNDCVVKQVLSVFTYGYEYQGNNGRLVMTPLTDRCYMTLGAAMFTRRGGNPLGPAGTGKTETVKDFGKALARYVIVFNCSDGVDFKMTGKMLSGLAQTGAWACLDEFNRIEVEVLSVVATQISIVMNAVKERKTRFMFLGTEIRLIPSCGVFVTMNPGYAGRSELPDNLKAIVRPVSMMVPDFTLIAEIMMFAEGFQTAKILAKKMVAIMELSQQQLSKQDHYDYGLRSFVIPIARAAGAMKRSDPDASEEVIMYRTMIDLIKPKLVYLDLPLFMALLSDLFPGVELPANDGGTLRAELNAQLIKAGLQIVPDYVTKIIQVFDCKVARHGNMIVGKTGAGKTEAWKCLKAAMLELKKKEPENEDYQKVSVHTINPLALSNDEIYGSFDPGTHEWTDGVLARIMRTVCKDESLDQKWILFDGPVDTLWIESMNTLLDDNKLLTLLSGERISMPHMVSILFEVEDLSQASPATVSRAGMIYLNVEDLGWAPYVTSWLQRKEAVGPENQVLVDTLRKCVDKYIEAATEFKRLNCRELVPVDRLNSIKGLCALFDSFALRDGSGCSAEEAESYVAMIELYFLFAMIWSVGGSLAEDGRKKFDMFLRELDPRYPSADSVYEYFVHPTKKTWAPWEEKLSANYRPAADTPFFKISVPTVDTIRTKIVVEGYVRDFKHVLVVGNVGVGKTLVINQVLASLEDGKSSMVMNFSAQTSSNSTQDTIEGKMEKRTKGVFAPQGGKKLVCFIDDLNMPQKSVFGFMPPLELLKLWVDNGFWYDRAKQEVKQIKDLQLLAAMAPPGGGRNPFSQRVQSCFYEINMIAPSDGQLKRIFGTMLNSKLSDFDDEIKPLGDSLTQACVEVYKQITEELLPTPSKSHYLFNTRDLAKVVQGVMQASKAYYDSKESVLSLFVHETFRIYGDRMWDHNDKAWLKALLDTKLTSIFENSWATLFEATEEVCPPFVSFMRQVEDPPYEPVTDMQLLKDFLMEKLEDYALEPGMSAMDLVLFQDALNHVCRIHRVILQPRGNALLVGVGGSGRKSLARLAAYVAEYKTFSIEITKNYRTIEFHEDLKALCRQAGCMNKASLFLFDDTQIVQETFLEDVNNILTSGEVPNLFTKDEIGGVCEEVRAAAKKEGAGETQDLLYAFFLERVRANLHVVLCLSPVGEAFRERCRMFPGLVNCTTIDWFTEWPGDALYEVAQRQLSDIDLGGDDVKNKICQSFVTAHSSVSEKSADMLNTLKRHNYVTPTNYLEFVNGYKLLVKEKRTELADKAQKLRGGLEKLDETSVQVGEMQVICEEKKVIVAKAKKDCEELLVTIVQDKRVADEQEKQVNAEATKIEKEAAEANAIAAECQEGLDKAMPALQAAEDALNVLTKKDFSELKAYAKPPALVELTLGAVMTVLKKAPTWDSCKKELGDTNFMERLLKFDKDLLVDALLKKIKKYTDNSDFTPDVIGKVSGAARGLCLWVRAMETYGHVSKEVAPKRAKLKSAQDTLAKKQAALAKAKEALAEVLAKVQALKDQYDESTSSKERLQAESDELEIKLERAEKLVTGLAGERTRWEASIERFDKEITSVPGDCMVAAAFLSYAGPFPSEYREELVDKTWLPAIKVLNIPASEVFDFANFLANPSDVRDWNIQGLPADAFSTENGVMVTRGRRWPLMVDPQGQANKWVKNMEKDRNLRVMSLGHPSMMREMENAIQFGSPVLLQDVLEEMDPALEPILGKAFIKKGNQILIKLGDKEVDYNPEFRLYITTKLANPHYTPEVSTKATIVNFSVKEQGLEAQLLNIVVAKERPDLDQQKNDLVVKVAAGKRTQAELEDKILFMLSTATGSLLDNVELINTLDESKTIWEEVNASLIIAEETSKKIEEASLKYRPCSIRSSLLYFVLNDLSNIDPMYQFSLDAYVDLFLQSIAKSTKSDVLIERIKNLNDFHTYSVYKYTSRGLFEKHKMLLSMQMCVRVLQSNNGINNDEWQYFLRGGAVLDKSSQPPNPNEDFLSEEMWDNITELEELANFKGVIASFQGDVASWEMWYRNKEPETAELPGEWEGKCNELQRMVFVRCLRPDRVMFAATSYVSNSLGKRFVEPPVLNLGETHSDSTALTPLIFVLSPGVDPTQALQTLATEKGLGDKFFFVALGQGQAPLATKLIDDGVRDGTWVFLANCHLMTSWLPTLDKMIEGFAARKPNPDFRLWLSSSPTPAFPIAILQRGVKMTTEPPKGLRANLLRLYDTISEESFYECKTHHKYCKLIFSLTYFHAVLLERRKFRSLGINIPYDFNDTDYKVSDDLLKSYLDEYEDTPWDALKYLIAEANYGGRVTDELDRRVLLSYLNDFYCEDALSVPNYNLSPLSTYFIPENGPLQSYKDYILTLPTTDRPEAFGQHPNADISYMIEDTKITLDSLTSLQPRTGGGGASKGEEIVDSICKDLLESVPQPFQLEFVMKAKADDPSALHVVLFQEIERYNVLLEKVKSSCAMLRKGIKGLVVMSSDLDQIYSALLGARVPAAWLKTYPSLKPLGPWTRDLLQRIHQLKTWVDEGYPKVYWLSGFTYPTGFLTAVLQTTARKNSIPIDTLSFEFSVVNVDESEITAPPKEGVYIRGMYLEGAGWDFENGCLCEPEPMELIVSMPMFHFKPVENKKKTQKGIYVSPMYLYPLRTGTRERPSFMINMDLKSGNMEADFWIKRGTAVLLALSTS
eukprot:CAMPEP_0182867354 /NCGR_PEP_ID=MMETSP0034_2-20130328/8675_1 /TAXON_ID=156128 /ORGANISM="Nephroselmis pyriformis, Strain CCMP717" /LENGTH=4528 /DNA_ID=CAMNT_0024999703 /DNA_START=83 /DNA_END=13669 /DNA_ORIENTATION=-